MIFPFLCCLKMDKIYPFKIFVYIGASRTSSGPSTSSDFCFFALAVLFCFVSLEIFVVWNIDGFKCLFKMTPQSVTWRYALSCLSLHIH